MYASALRSDERAAAIANPARQRAQGRVVLTVGRLGHATRPLRISEGGSLRVRLPRALGGAIEGVVINTAGGVACGDRYDVEASVGPGADLVLTTPAAEKVYRSDGPRARISVRASVAEGAALSWLPQETILFEAARLQRRLDIEIAESARLTLFEAVVFGRTAAGEEIGTGFFEDRWRVRRGGRLTYADTLRLSGPMATILDRATVGGGARALATLLHVAPDAEARLEQARELLGETAPAAAASAWNGLLAVRFLARNAGELRGAVVRFLEGFRGAALPRLWRS